jgi:hypothetical protein
MQEQWRAFEQDETRMAQLGKLIADTQELTKDLHGAPAWVHDTQAVELRWRHATEVCAHIHDSAQGGPAPGERLRDGFDHMTRTIEKLGWQTPGIAFMFTNYEGSPGRADRIDLRDMNEPDSFVNMSFEEFKAYSDEQVEALRQKLIGRIASNYNIASGRGGKHGDYCLFTLPGTSDNQEQDDSYRFGDYSKWRRYGKPDKEVPYEDIVDYCQDLLDARRVRNPEYGAVPDSFNSLTGPQKEHVSYIFDYLWQSRNLDEQPLFDDYSLQETMGSTFAMAEKLAAKGVLDIILRSDNGKPARLMLTESYSNLWFARHPALQKSDDIEYSCLH